MKKRQKDECCKCGGVIEPHRVLSNQKFCNKCQTEYTREYRKKRNYLTIGNNQKQKHYARTYANTYLKRGLIKREGCCICGNEKSEMHHDDYTKPLEVKWFCRSHHLEHHKKIANVL